MNSTNISHMMNQAYRKPLNTKKMDVEKYIRKIYEKIMESAIIIEGDISWLVPRLLNNKWQFVEAGFYLYDGIAGIFVFFHYLDSVGEQSIHKEVLKLLDKKMFAYTDSRIKKIYDNKGKLGIYEGESSVAFVYLLVYAVTGEKQYLTYAKKHCLCIKRGIQNDRNYDLLEGNAGVIMLYSLMYEMTGAKIYLSWAEQAAIRLLDRAVFTEEGLRWVSQIEGAALLGVSHGCAGIAWAFAKLYHVTKKRCYEEIVKQIIKYENTYYDNSIEDWEDRRKESYMWKL